MRRNLWKAISEASTETRKAMTLLPTIKLEVQESPYCLIGGEIDEMLALVKRLPDRKWGEYAGKGNVWILPGTIVEIRAALSPLQVWEPGDELREAELRLIESARAEVTSRETEIQKESIRLSKVVAGYSVNSKSLYKGLALSNANCLRGALVAAEKPIKDLVEFEALTILRAIRLINVSSTNVVALFPRTPRRESMSIDLSLLYDETLSATLRKCLPHNSDDFHIQVQLAITIGGQLRWNREAPPTAQQEANAMIAFAVRNSKSFENHHITQVPMRNADVKLIMIESSERMTQWLMMKRDLGESFPELYFQIVHGYLAMFADLWKGSQVAVNDQIANQP